MKKIVGLLMVSLAGSFTLAQNVTSKPASAPASNPATVLINRDTARHKAILKAAEANKYDVIMLGDSITEGFKGALWEKYYVPLKAGNFGISGDQTGHVLWRLTEGKELDNQDPKLVVLLIGVNNLWGKKFTPEQIADATGTIVTTLRTKFPKVKVLILGVLPTANPADNEIRGRVKAINALTAKLADGKDIRFLDFGDKMLESDGSISKEVMPDLLHPGPKGYQIWIDNVNPVIEQMLGKATSTER